MSKAELDATTRATACPELFRSEKVHSHWMPVLLLLTPPAAGNAELSGECDAQRVDPQCSHTDAVVHRPCRPGANCAATNAVTRRACAGSQAQSDAGAASHHQRVRQGYEGRRGRRSGNG